MKFVFFVTIVISITACSGGNSSSGFGGNITNTNNTPALSSGLKIFVTSDGHVGDFANDPLLSGSNAIEKADSFCNNDPNKPNSSTYKALLVDGITRDAISLTDWVLESNTTYYRPYGDIEIGTTINTAIIPVLFKELTNSVEDERPQSSNAFRLTNITYTGISNPADFSTNGSNTCNNWSNATNLTSSNWGRIYETTANSISTNGLIACDYIASLYCVEQR